MILLFLLSLSVKASICSLNCFQYILRLDLPESPLALCPSYSAVLAAAGTFSALCSCFAHPLGRKPLEGSAAHFFIPFGPLPNMTFSLTPLVVSW